MLCSKHVTSWKYLTVQLSRLSADDAGDPDLYGMFYGGSSVRFRTCTSIPAGQTICSWLKTSALIDLNEKVQLRVGRAVHPAESPVVPCWHSERLLTSLQAKPLEKATFGYDFRETSSSSHEHVVKKVKKSDVSATFDHQGEQQFCNALESFCFGFLPFSTQFHINALCERVLAYASRGVPVHQGLRRGELDLLPESDPLRLPR